MLCQASRNSSPWHNFVTDTDHWKEVNGATLCLNNGGIYNRDEMAPMKTIGAKCIWADTQAATFEGSPSPKFSPGMLLSFVLGQNFNNIIHPTHVTSFY